MITAHVKFIPDEMIPVPHRVTTTTVVRDTQDEIIRFFYEEWDIRNRIVEIKFR